MIIQHKSDMIRSLLLVKFGGIWIDASVMCVQPLSKWMDYSKPFVTFVRNDQFMDKNANGKPVIGKKNMPLKNRTELLNRKVELWIYQRDHKNFSV